MRRTLWGPQDSSGAVRIKNQSGLKIQWKSKKKKKTKPAPALFLSCPLSVMALATNVLPHWAIRSLGKYAAASFPPAKPLTQPQETAESGASLVLAVGSAAMQGSSYSQQKRMGTCQSFTWPCPDTAENHYLWLYIFSFVCRHTEIFIRYILRFCLLYFLHKYIYIL